jgi:DNA-binding response OmpR family regulator
LITETEAPLSQVKILVVDDELAAVDEIVFALRSAGFDAIGVTSAVAALECFLLDPSIGVVLTDIRMPKQDGIGFLRQVRSCGARGETAELIVATGYPEAESAIRSIDLRVGKYLVKPVDPGEMLSSVAKAVEAYRRSLRPASDDSALLSGLAKLLDGRAPEKYFHQSGEAPPHRVDPTTSGEETRVRTLEAMLEIRRVRSQLLPQEIFSDPAWFMLLELALLEKQGKQISVSGICLTSGVSQTTALRRVQDMVEAGLLIRRDDPQDKRRVHVSLSPTANSKLNSLLDLVGDRRV